MKKPNILIVEDELLIAEMLKEIILDLGYLVAGIAKKYKEAEVFLSKNKEINFVFADINLSSKKTGIDLVRFINEKYGYPTVYLTSYSDSKTIKEASSTFPSSYLVKPFKPEEIHSTIEVVWAKKLASSNEIIYNKLTEREADVYKLLLTGATDKDISQQLFVSLNTVKTHLKSIYSKLEVSSRTEAVSISR